MTTLLARGDVQAAEIGITWLVREEERARQLRDD